MSEESEKNEEGVEEVLEEEEEEKRKKTWRARTVDLKAGCAAEKAQELEDKLNELETDNYGVSQIFAQEGTVVILGRLIRQEPLFAYTMPLRTPAETPSAPSIPARTVVNICTAIVDSMVPREKRSEQAEKEVSDYLSSMRTSSPGAVDILVKDLDEWEKRHNSTCAHDDPAECEMAAILGMAKSAVIKYREIRTN